MHVVGGAVVVVTVSVTAVVVILRRALVLRDVQGGCGHGRCHRAARLTVGGGHHCALGDVHDEERDEHPESEHESSGPLATDSRGMASHSEHRMEVLVGSQKPHAWCEESLRATWHRVALDFVEMVIKEARDQSS